MPKRDRQGKYSRIYQPVAKAQVVVVRDSYDDAVGQSSLDWWIKQTVSQSAREYTFAPYDRDAVASVMLQHGGLKQFINKLCPTLHAERKRQLYDNIVSIMAAKKHKLDRDEQAQRKGQMHRARRLTKVERRDKRHEKRANSLKELKALLHK